MNNWFNAQIFNSVARWAVNSAALALVSHGVLTQTDAQTAGGAVLSLAMLAFGVISARTKHVALTVAGGGNIATGAAAVNAVKNGATPVTPATVR